MMKDILLVLGLIFQFVYCSSQDTGYGNNWILGQGGPMVKSGVIMDFNKNPVEVAFLEKDFSMAGGTNVSMSNRNGNLLFYSNGCAIWDRNQEQMPNSYEILPNMQFFGCPESNAAIIFGAMILPDPCKEDMYKFINLEQSTDIFILGTLAASSLMYSEVDMNSNEGKGEVAAKHVNIISDTLSPGNISATRHANGRDWWITVLKLHTNCFYSILLNEKGFQEPILSCTGPEWIRSGVGASCFSPNGKTYVRFNPQGCSEVRA